MPTQEPRAPEQGQQTGSTMQHPLQQQSQHPLQQQSQQQSQHAGGPPRAPGAPVPDARPFGDWASI